MIQNFNAISMLLKITPFRYVVPLPLALKCRLQIVCDIVIQTITKPDLRQQMTESSESLCSEQPMLVSCCAN